VDAALENNPTTAKAWWNAKRAAGAEEAALTAFLPKLDLQANVTRGREFEFVNGPDRYFTNLQANLVLSMLLLDFGERAAKSRQAVFALKAAGWENDQAIQKVMADVLERSFELMQLEEEHAAILESLEDAKRLLDIAEKLNRAGARARSDILQAKNSLLDIELEEKALESDIAIKRGLLAILIGYGANAKFEIAKIEAPLLPDHEMKEMAGKARADLLAQQAKTRELQAKMQTEEAKALPKLRFSCQAGPSAYMTEHEADLTYKLNLELKSELFHGFQSIYQKRVAYSAYKISLEEQAELERKIADEIFEEMQNLAAKDGCIASAGERLKNAEKAFEAAYELYRSGYRVQFSEVFYAKQKLKSARVAACKARIGLKTCRARLAYALGTIASYVRESSS
jgi:outer membrane protein TolC